MNRRSCQSLYESWLLPSTVMAQTTASQATRPPRTGLADRVDLTAEERTQPDRSNETQNSKEGRVRTSSCHQFRQRKRPVFGATSIRATNSAPDTAHETQPRIVSAVLSFASLAERTALPAPRAGTEQATRSVRESADPVTPRPTPRGASQSPAGSTPQPAALPSS